jgi:hypothetical protein
MIALERLEMERVLLKVKKMEMGLVLAMNSNQVLGDLEQSRMEYSLLCLS